MMITRFIHVCIASIALTSLTVVFVLLPVTTPPSAWAIQEPLPSLVTTISSIISTEETRRSRSHSNNDESQLIDLTTFQYILNVKSCNISNLPILLVFVHSAPQNFEKRNIIRKTWGSYLSSNIRILFMLGKPKILNEQSQLLKEQYINNDIVQGNFIDKYRNITYKHVMGFKWINYNCNNITYILKTDDDVFINMPNLIKFLPSLPTSRLIFCDVIKNAGVKRSWRSKWRISYSEFAGRIYPDYCAGWAILYTGDVVKELYLKAQLYNYFWVDDVHLTGVLAKKAEIKHLPAEEWKLQDYTSNTFLFNKKWPNNLTDKYLIGPYNTSPNSIESLWELLMNEISQR